MNMNLIFDIMFGDFCERLCLYFSISFTQNNFLCRSFHGDRWASPLEQGQLTQRRNAKKSAAKNPQRIGESKFG